jgi:hypothetical protein
MATSNFHSKGWFEQKLLLPHLPAPSALYCFPANTPCGAHTVRLHACTCGYGFGCWNGEISGIVTGANVPPPPPGGLPFNPGEQLPGPSDPSSPAVVAAWRVAMQGWQTASRAEVKNGTAAYDDPQLKWTRTSYIQPQMHPYDRYFFDPRTGNYTVQKWLDDVTSRYGGVDSILMWSVPRTPSCHAPYPAKLRPLHHHCTVNLHT